MWFEDLVGFPEESPQQVQGLLFVEDSVLHSRKNGKSYRCGTLEIPSLEELRGFAKLSAPSKGQLSFSEVIADVQSLHKDPENAGALFQAASQFNLLEMVHPGVSPEKGVGIYANDFTQGPACAIACGAGTIYRNYFHPIGDQIGQSSTLQVDCLSQVGKNLGHSADTPLWEMKNGYLLTDAAHLEKIDEALSNLDLQGVESLKGQLMIGLQWETEVTIAPQKHLVSQAYCSALPIAYNSAPAKKWEKFARLVLEAAYEATLLAGIINLSKTGSNKVFLTLLGGGAFGNPSQWILDALGKVLNRYNSSPLDVKLVSYRYPTPGVEQLLH